jgi:septal ring factor EnvC (AmiA/AmiB activator)
MIEQIRLKAAQEALESNLEETSQKLAESEKETEMSKEEIKKMQREHAEMKAELEALSKQLESVTDEFTALSQEKDRRMELREVVALVMTLLVEVFGAQPHSKLLFLLHGQKENMDRSALTKASGIGGAIVRHTLADLKAAKLIDYDVETGKVTLLKKVF